MQGYAGVIARYDGLVAMVREQYHAWDAPYWNLPSGGVEDGETPAAGAVRELREESGLHVSVDELELVWTTQTQAAGRVTSRSWNYVVDVADPAFAIDDPDGSVMAARWFTPEDAVRRLGRMPYPPIAVPAIHYLAHGTRGRAWRFTLSGDEWSW
ncbi:8-oxo-dGTP diphosphatase [Kribbella aluminosa]|uniref:8-oxo-dGTP diphosphatase n=1 Tax=Kribbella aluminosa TaxID=416017 RepID=A0ABS4UC24_9ACTN|nr:NUDIX hydrolase [Kribbella aluminosa]MBP2349186.1 8-oxo-dGTP diphosphatase [Kribbella aluminosa]